MKRSPCMNGISFFILAPMKALHVIIWVLCPILAALSCKVLYTMVEVLNLETILVIVTAFLFSSFRALLSCGLVCCILSSGFTFNEVRIKSVLVLLYAFLSATSLRTVVYYLRRHYELLFIILATLD